MPTQHVSPLLAKELKSLRLRDEVEAGTNTVDDDEEHFFQRGREFEAVGDAHHFTAQELKTLESFESLEYLPPNNAVYRAYMSDPKQMRPSQTSRWVAMGLIGLAVGFVGFMLKSIIDRIAEFRKSLLFNVECRGDPAAPALYSCGGVLDVIEVGGEDPAVAAADAIALADAAGDGVPPGGTLVAFFPVFAGVAVAFACAASCVVVFVQPAAASSGIPEVIAYLNGTHQRKIFNLRTLLVKFISCFLAVGSGLAVGPEGPMIHMGAMVGRGVSQMRSSTLGFNLSLFKHFRNNKDARDFLTAGAAAGVASAFGAPVGGLLFALEEVASTWSQTLTWQIFFCAMTAASTTIVLSSAFGGFSYSGRFGQLHAGGSRSAIEFYVSESIDANVMLFVPSVMIGGTCGILGAAFTFINLKIARFRRKHIAPVKAYRVLEPMCNMFLFAILTFGLTMLYPCTDVEGNAQPQVLAEGELVRLHCPVGQYNELATLMYASGHNAVLLLFSRRDDETGLGRGMFSGGSVAIFFVCYFLFACAAAGSAISTGLVVPMLLIGACIGRLYGIAALGVLVHADNQPVSLAACPAGDASFSQYPATLPSECYFSYVDPGAFALIGAAAFFGGVSRLTIALTVIMIEITNDVRFLLPIMLAVMVAKWVADSLTHSLYHAIIEAKCFPFLNPEICLHGARDGDLEVFKVADLLATLHGPPVVTLRANPAGGDAGATYGSVAKTLSETGHGAYPVVDAHGRFQGLVTRAQLLPLLVAAAKGGSSLAATTGMPYLQLLSAAERAANDPEGTAAALIECANDAGLMARPLDLGPYIDGSAVAVRDHFSLHRAYMVFRTMGLRHLVVTDADNRAVGVVTRRDLMDFRLHDVLHPHGHHDHGGGHGHHGGAGHSNEHEMTSQAIFTSPAPGAAAPSGHASGKQPAVSEV